MCVYETARSLDNLRFLQLCSFFVTVLRVGDGVVVRRLYFLGLVATEAALNVGR